MKRWYKLVISAIGLFACSWACAQGYPQHAIRLVVPFPPGSIADLTGRSVAQALGADLKQAIVVENRPGVTGSLGSDMVSKAPADGYTLLVGNDATHATNQLLYLDVHYDPTKDFTPIAPAVDSVIVLVVNRSLPVHSVEELVKLARTDSTLSFGSSGVGSPHHLAGEMLNKAAHIHLVHVPYKGGAPAVTDALGGQIGVLFTSLGSVRPYLDNGQLRALAVLTKARYAGLPDVPALDETYPGVEISGWTAFFGPPNMPPAIVARLNAGIQKALAEPAVASVLTHEGLTPTPGPPEALRSLVEREVVRRGEIIRSLGIRRE